MKNEMWEPAGNENLFKAHPEDMGWFPGSIFDNIRLCLSCFSPR